MLAASLQDPYLTSVYAREIISAMQGGFGAGNTSAKYFKTIATPKHFVGQIFEGGDMGNHTTMDRTRNDSRISIQDLEGYYLRPFRAALVEGGSGSLMCAYSGAVARVLPRVRPHTSSCPVYVLTHDVCLSAR